MATPPRVNDLSRWTPALVLGAVLLLLGSMLLVLLVRRELGIFPSAVNTRPSGMAALAELLRRDGLEVSLDRRDLPRFRSQDLVLAFAAEPIDDFFAAEPEEAVETPIERAMAKHVAAGGRLVYAQVPGDFDDATRRAEEILEGRYRFRFDPHFAAARAPYPSLPVPSNAFEVRVGRVTLLATAQPFTNRHLDELDHARFILDLVRREAQPGGRVVFAEAVAGNVETVGVFGAIGDWAVAARNQILLLLLVVAWSVGVRFGAPWRPKVVQRGFKDLSEATAEVLRRGKKAGFALELIAHEALERIRHAQRAPAGAKLAELDMPEDTRDLLKRASLAGEHGLDPREATRLAGRLLASVREFERDSRARR